MHSLRILSFAGSGFELQKEKTNFPEERKDQSVMQQTICCYARNRMVFSFLSAADEAGKRASPLILILMMQVNQFPLEFANISLFYSS
jgi:hypothetical protein